MAKQLEEVLYTANTHTTSGRDGTGRSSDGALDVQLSPPGSGKPGTNPELLTVCRGVFRLLHGSNETRGSREWHRSSEGRGN